MTPATTEAEAFALMEQMWGRLEWRYNVLSGYITLGTGGGRRESRWTVVFQRTIYGPDGRIGNAPAPIIGFGATITEAINAVAAEVLK